MLSYANDQFLTSDAVATAVLSYSRALAQNDEIAVVMIPVLVDEKQTTAEVIIGPASQITALHINGEMEIRDAGTVEDLTRRAALLDSPPAAMPDTEHPASRLTDYDLRLD